MPKVYFFDLGLRNFFVSNFKSFEIREDRGSLLENAVWRQLLEKYDENSIRFWRTIQKNEVDFVAGEELAFEVKSRAEQFKEKAYKIFKANYPNVDLSIVSLDSKIERLGNHKILEVWQI